MIYRGLAVALLSFLVLPLLADEKQLPDASVAKQGRVDKLKMIRSEYAKA